MTSHLPSNLRQKIDEQLNPEKFPLLSQANLQDCLLNGKTLMLVFDIPTGTSPEIESERLSLEACLTTIDRRISGCQVMITAKSASPLPKSHAKQSQLDHAKFKRIIAVASGKGGVGKSTVATNLAVSLAQIGYCVGLLDADIYGPSIPCLMGFVNTQTTALQQNNNPTQDMLKPQLLNGVYCMSMGMLIPDGRAFIWRGPMIQKAIVQMFRDVDWPALDILVLDMPPGTGDAQLTVAQKINLDSSLIVTTPQAVALADVTRAIAMFQKMNVNVAGIVENMAGFVCPDTGKTHHIFPRGPLKTVSRETNTQILASFQISPDLAATSDAGTPLAKINPQHAISRTYAKLAKHISDSLKLAPTAQTHNPQQKTA